MWFELECVAQGLSGVMRLRIAAPAQIRTFGDRGVSRMWGYFNKSLWNFVETRRAFWCWDDQSGCCGHATFAFGHRNGSCDENAPLLLFRTFGDRGVMVPLNDIIMWRAISVFPENVHILKM